MIKLDQSPGQYYLRFAAVPIGDMQQVIEGTALVEYTFNGTASLNHTISLANVSAKPPFGIYDDLEAVHLLVNGSAKEKASSLLVEDLVPFESIPPPAGPVAETKSFNISQTDIVVWVIDGHPYAEPKIPIIHGNVSDGWNANTTLHMPSNSAIDIIMRISSDSMDTASLPCSP